MFGICTACTAPAPVSGEEAARRAEIAPRERATRFGSPERRPLAHRAKSEGKYWIVDFWDPASKSTGGGGVVWVDKQTGSVKDVGLGQ